MEASVERQTTVHVCPSCGTQYPLDVLVCPQDKTSLIKQMPDPLIGMMLPRHYKITGKLGRGAMSVVYRGIYEPLEQEVAIKLLKSHLVSDHQTFQRFQQEAKTAGALEHPSIVGIFDFGVTDQGVPYLIMELLRGQSLAERLKKEKCLSVDLALELFIQVADALDYTHQRGIVHRDVKPSNILLMPGGDREVVKIVDFGIAKLQAYEGNPGLNLTATGEVFGTPLYVSPEQATGKNIDARADIYSFGCVMYEAIVGRPAFSGPTAFDVIRMQLSVDPMPIHRARPDLELPPPLAALIARAMAKNPDDRYQRMSDLIIDLHRAQSLTATTKLTTSKTRAAVSPSSFEPIKTFKDSNALNQPRNSADTMRARDLPLTPQSVPALSNKRQSGASPPVAGSVNGSTSFPFMSFLFACLSGCLAGVLVLFCMQQKRMMEHAPMRQPAASTRSSGGITTAAGMQTNSVEMTAMDAEARFHWDKATQLYHRQNFSLAEKEERRAIEILQKKAQKVPQAVALSDLCRIYMEEGKLNEAHSAGRKAVELLQGGPPSQKVNLAIAMEGLAQASMRKDDLKTAEQLYENALQTKKRSLAPDDPEIAKTMHGLAVLKQVEGAHSNAEQLYKQALSIRQAKLGPDSADTANTLCCLGTLYVEQKKFAAAEDCLYKAYQIDSKVKTQSDAIARDLACLGKLYEGQNKHEQAEASMRQALAMTDRVYGHGSPRLLPRLKGLAALLKNHHKNVEAQALEREARVIQGSK